MRLPAWLTSQEATYGSGALLAVLTRQGRSRRLILGQVSAFIRQPRTTASPERLLARSAARLRQRLDERRLAAIMAAAGHPKRLVILAELLGGAAIYRQLVRATDMKAGPLYHHINKLRLAGLVRVLGRDLYDLTETGRAVFLALLAADGLVHRGKR